jgi:hypothetical protein
MKNIDRSLRNYFSWIALYLILALLLPANKSVMHAYNLSANQYHLLFLFIVLPYAGIWYAAFYGYTMMQKYVALISTTKEGTNFQTLANGFGWLAWSLPITAVSTLLLYSYANSSVQFHAASVIINNYIVLILPLIGFVLLRKSSQKLLSTAHLIISRWQMVLIGSLFATLGVAYCLVTFRHLDLNSVANSANPFYLPNWLVLVSLTLPFLVSWLIGLTAAFELFIFSKESSGLLYRRSLLLLALGVFGVVISSVSLQYLNIMSPAHGNLSLNYQLFFAYMIRFVSAVGYILIAIGALRLKRIEEV